MSCPRLALLQVKRVAQVTHEEFQERARATARNAGGLRPLAAHIRRLYPLIRTLQSEDNSFYYIAEVVQMARGDKTDATQFMTRVKTYHHRDRVAAGDPLVHRGMPAASIVALEQSDATQATSPTARRTIAMPFSDSVEGRQSLSRTQPSELDNSARTGERAPPSVSANNPSRTLTPPEHRSFAEALYARPGRRRLADAD